MVGTKEGLLVGVLVGTNDALMDGAAVGEAVGVFALPNVSIAIVWKLVDVNPFEISVLIKLCNFAIVYIPLSNSIGCIMMTQT